MLNNSNTLQLADGRMLGYAETGATDGQPVILCHGLPGSRMEGHLVEAAAIKLKLKIITPDRPGYGLSTPQPHHTLLQWADDVIKLADHLDFRSFHLIGISGGAPRALAIVAKCTDRLKKVAIVCGLAPLYQTGLSKNMNRFTKLSFWLAYHSPRILKSLVGTPISAITKLSPAFALQTLRLYNRGVDGQLLLEPKIRQLIELDIREAFRQGPIGAAHEMRLYTRPWGFKLEDLKIPITIWHGDSDTIVPLEHSNYLHSHLPNSQLTIVPGEAHFSLPIRRTDTILQSLLDMASD